MGKEQQNCPFCDLEATKKSGGWTLSKKDWKDMKEKHEREHLPIVGELS